MQSARPIPIAHARERDRTGGASPAMSKLDRYHLFATCESSARKSCEIENFKIVSIAWSDQINFENPLDATLGASYLMRKAGFSANAAFVR
jgi:hypothetical protein